jgi:hypothetical protein
MSTFVGALLVLLLALGACGRAERYSYAGPVGKAIGQEVRNKRAKIITISALTVFEWDELFLFGPYLPKVKACEILQVPVNACEKTISVESEDDGEMTIAFRFRGKLVHLEKHARWYGDFTPTPSLQPISKPRAVFRVEAQGQATDGSQWYKLMLQ